MVKKDKTQRNRIIKITIASFIALLMVLGTIFSAVSFSIDDNDAFYLEKGDEVQGSFVIEGTNNYELDSTMEWITLSSQEPTRIIDDSYQVFYDVKVPENADIGVYRGTIEVKEGQITKYVNIKISVQNKVVSGLERVFTNPKFRIPIISISSVFLVVFLLFMYMREKDGRR